MNSCNVFFYNTGRKVGVDAIANYSNKFGLGRPTDIDLPQEEAGLVPNRIWKSLVKREKWYDGETINYAIGQGYLLVTPIQMLKAANVVAQSGELIRPYLVKQVGSVVIAEKHFKNTGISKRALDQIRTGIVKVVNDPHGTGQRAMAQGLKIAGKTGTAETSKGGAHAWFVGFSPAENAKLSMVVFIEHGGMGGYAAAELAGEIFKNAAELGLVK